jgi:predicted nucleic acid-binding protein
VGQTGAANGLTLDAGGLIAVDRQVRTLVVLLARAAETGARLTVPAPALAQAIRDPARQVRLARLVRQPMTAVIPLDRADALVIGGLLAATKTSDVVDAHVVVCAQRSGQAIVTSDSDDIRRLDPKARLVAV